MKKDSEQLKELIDALRHYHTSKMMYALLLRDECKIPMMPTKYYMQLDLKKHDLLGSLLEAYHLKRLNDDI